MGENILTRYEWYNFYNNKGRSRKQLQIIITPTEWRELISV